MQAVILAAGLGQRIQPVTNSIPKCLLEVNGKRIIRYQLDILHSNGITDIAVVVGHLKEKIIGLLGDEVKYIENPVYKDSNSSYSLWLAKDAIAQGFIYLNGDLLFAESILRRLLLDPSENAIAVDKTRVKFEDDMFKANLMDGVVVELSKRLDFQKTSAAAPGPVKFSKLGKDVLFKNLHQIIRSGDRSQWCYSIFSKIAPDLHFKGVDVAGLPWIEIDTAEDLEKARQMEFI